MRQRNPIRCIDRTTSCGDRGAASEVVNLRRLGPLRRELQQALKGSGAIVGTAELDRFAEELDRSIRHRRRAARRWRKDRLSHDDIIRLILDARDSDDRNEAIWRAFLAAHFGRESSSKSVERQALSASRLLCAFGPVPVWTWEKASVASQSLRRWLLENRQNLASLSFGNHRKYESKQPQGLWEVIDSFVRLAQGAGGTPSALLAIDARDEGSCPFDALYRRLAPLRRFGRTGRFDFLTLLADLDLTDVRPTSCYLKGATGPLSGARRMWGKLETVALDRVAQRLAESLGVSPVIVEDALCNWQKD